MRKPNLANVPGALAVPAPVKSDPHVYERLGKRVAEAREEARLTQEQLGEMVGESAITISRWETASRRPTVDDVMKLAAALERDVVFFLDENPSVDSSIKVLNRAAGRLPPQDVEELVAIAKLKQKRYAAQRLSAENIESEDDQPPPSAR